jgi:tRNA pseudouridine38-40 synthase
MRNVRMQIAYDGSAFFGWQRQDGFESVQECLEEAIESATNERIIVQGSGRTDTGVHGLRQVGSCHTSTQLSDDRLRHAINAHLPDSVVVNRLETCADDFHARFSATGKRYLYVTSTTRFRQPHGRDYMSWSHFVLDFEAMRRAGAALVGTHDFAGLCTHPKARHSTVRTVRDLKWIRRRDSLSFVIEADGFLYNMVRAIAGTLFDVGRGRLPEEIVAHILATGDRTRIGPTAPAEGLYLLRVLYDEPTFVGRDVGPRGAPGAIRG